MSDSTINAANTDSPAESATRPERYDPQAIEQKWSERWAANPDFYTRRTRQPHRARNITCLRCCPILRAHCTWDTCATTPLVTPWRATCGCRATTCFIPWAGTPSACPQRTPRSRTRRRPANGRSHNIAAMKMQMKRLGFAYDWSKELATCLPHYYRWNQWFFLKFLREGCRLSQEQQGELVSRVRRRFWLTSRCCPTAAAGVTRPRPSSSANWSSGSCASPITPINCSTSLDSLPGMA